jgi:alpha-L-arabinofuranosidase
MGGRLFAAALALPLVLFGAQGAQAAQAVRPSPAPGAAQAASLAGYWKFDEGTGTTAADSSGGGHPLTLQGGASWTTGVVGPHALSVIPQQDAASSVPVVDTSNSFTVSAWVNLSNTNGFQTFVSEDGTQVSAFYLQLRGDTHRFALTRLAYDSPAAFTTIATSSIVPQPGVWYLLTGEYDATAGTISLYVDGQLQQTVAAAGAPWPVGGPFAVGRGFYNGNPTDWVSGAIDDVRAYSGTLPARQVAALAGTGSITVHTDQAGPTLNPTQFGAFLEEISHSGDGGIYAELVRNRDLKESSSSPAYWSAVQDRGASATIALDASQPLNTANPVSLRLSVSSLPAGGRAGIANDGYWGMPVKSATSYHLSFFAKAGASFTGPLTASLESTGGKVWATATIPAVTTSWAKYTATLTTPKGIPATLTNRLIISASDTAAAGASVWFGMVSLFPPTYDNTPNGLRVDLMQKLAALHPGYFRIPGGNYLEGDTLDTYFNWKNTIGPVENRPGHFNSAWGYWSQDGMGLLEYLEMAEEVAAQPMLAVFAGYTLNGTVVPQGQLAPYVQAALDEIQYAIGPTDSTYGAMRAADGHPAPFDLHYVEIGNEDQFDGSGSYNAYRFPMFYDAIKAAYPQLKIIATRNVTSRTPDVIDDHYYTSDPAVMAGNAHNYDSTSRTGPKHIVGEYAVTQGSPTGTLAGALGEAAFLTGLERDADVVTGASYAPLLVNVNAPSWSTNLIGYNGLVSYGSPSYYAQKMLVDNLGHQVAPSQIVGGNGNLWAVATVKAGGFTYLTVVNRGSSAATVNVDLAGVSRVSGGTATVLTSNPTAMNSIAHPTAVTPTSRKLGPSGPSFSYTFPANSLTVLSLATS